MSKEKQEEKQQKETKVIKGRPRKKKRAGTKKLDLKKSSELFQEEFYIYWPDPSLNLSEYEDEDGDFDVDTIPDEYLIEFTCRYIDPGTFLEIVDTPFAYDLPSDKQLSEKELEKITQEAINDRIRNQKSQAQVRYEIIQACVIDPQFESPEQVKKILPMSLQMELYDEITKGAIGENLVARFQEPNR